MTLTLLAILMVFPLLKMVLDPSGMYRILKEWSNSPALQFLSTLFPLLLALLILTTSTPRFEWNWDSMLTWMAVVIAVKGASHLFPSVVKWKMNMISEKNIPVFGFLGLLLALALVYIDTQVL